LKVLKQRIITAAVLIPVVIISSLLLDTALFAILLATFICIGAWEWAGMSGYSGLMSRGFYSLFIFVVLNGCYIYRDTLLSTIIMGLALIWWLIAIVLVMTYKQEVKSILDSRIPRASIGVLVLVPAWLSLILLQSNGVDGLSFLLFLLIMIWVADSAAYFTGRRWGKTKLVKEVSPGKSWEGVLGAILATFTIALIFALATNMQGFEILVFLSICIITVLGSILGDLMESLIKRRGRLKDSGSLLPGHGGVMDRLDSLTAAGPIFLAGLWLFKEIP